MFLHAARRERPDDVLAPDAAATGQEAGDTDTGTPESGGADRVPDRQLFLLVDGATGAAVDGLVEQMAPQELWELFRSVVPPTVVTRPQGGGRRRAGDRETLAAILFAAASGCAWRKLPPVFGPSWQTVYRRFAQWDRDRVWTRLHRAVLDARRDQGESDWCRRAVGAVVARAATSTEP
ncbi:transposase [Streptomyces sp. NPDC001508]|uniref:transposase n=1 Tax=Streptomyces sp. NPDC001508 TaxID=3154656 RepID=UPI0033323947